MKTGLQQIIQSLPAEKYKSDTLWAKIIIRRLSFYVTWVFLRMNISAWSVSVISIAFPWIALLFWIRLEPVMAAIFLNLWLLLDCVDGNIARINGEKLGGRFVDASSGYMMVGTYTLGLGIYLDLVGKSFFGLSSPWFIMMGAVSSILNLMARLYHQKFINTMKDGCLQNRKNSKSTLQLMEKNIGIGGFLTPVTLVFGHFMINCIFY